MSRNLRDSDRPAYGSVPPKGTMVYRGQRGTPGPTAGIHWSTSPDTASNFTGANGPDGPGEMMAVELTDPANQVIPYGALTAKYYDTIGNVRTGDYAGMQGFPHEQEIRLRPGAKFNVNGREVEIDSTPGRITYPDIHEFATTSEAANREWFHAVNKLGHVQTAMFDSVHDRGPGNEPSGPAKGYVQALDTRPDPYSPETMDKYVGDILKFGHHPEADWFPSHQGESMDQYVKPPQYRDRAPEAAASSSQFRKHYDVPLPGMDHA